MKVTLFWLILMFLGIQKNCQGQFNDSLFRQAINLSHDQSYISAFGGLGNIDPLYFEAAITPYYMLRLNKSKWGIELSPKVVLRMYQAESCPVRTPSYMPAATFYYNTSTFGKKSPLFVFLTWRHHSNGQNGYFYNDDSISINTISGNFSTNMMEFGVFATKPDKSKAYNSLYHKVSLEYHYYQDNELKGKYGNFRINSELQSIWYPGKIPSVGRVIKSRLYSVKTQLKVQWIAGNMLKYDPFDKKRLVASLRIALHPIIFNEVTLFAQYYYGQDYYNIHFSRTLSLLRFGILTDLSN